MPFDFHHPKGLQEPDPKTKFNPHLIDRRWPEDRYDLKGGIFPVRPDDCFKGCPGKRYNDRNFSNNFIRTRTMYHIPGTVPGLKNTRTVQRILHEPAIKFTYPKFTHKPTRSTSHIRVPKLYKTALCKITDNLREKEQNTHQYRIMKMKADQIAAVHENADIEKALKEFGQRFSHQFYAATDSSETKIFEDKKANKNVDPVIEVCHQGKLLAYVRKNVAKDLRLQEEEDRLRLRCFPSASKIAYEIEDYNKNPGAYPPDRYAYDPDGGMAMMCMKKEILAKFFESPSDKKLHHKSINQVDSQEEIYRLPSFPNFKRHTFTPSLVELIMKAPTHGATKRISRNISDDFHTHLGLIDDMKKEAFNKVVGQLNRREFGIEFPKELSSVNAKPKDLPDHIEPSIIVPEHLTHNEPATREEIRRVERAIVHDRKAEKIRRSKGITKPLTSMSMQQERLSKALNLPEDQQSVELDSETDAENRKQSQAAAIHGDMCQELKDFQRKVRKSSRRDDPTFNVAQYIPISLVCPECDDGDEENQCEKVEHIQCRKRAKDILDSFSTSSSSAEEEMSGVSGIPTSIVANSSDNLDYSDIAFSDIAIGSKDVPDIKQNPFYRTIAKDNQCSSSDNSLVGDESSMTLLLEELIDDISVTQSFFSGNDQPFLDDDDEEEEEEEEEEEVDYGEFRDMLENILKNDSKMIDDVFRESNAMSSVRSTIYIGGKNDKSTKSMQKASVNLSNATIGAGYSSSRKLLN